MEETGHDINEPLLKLEALSLKSETPESDETDSEKDDSTHPSPETHAFLFPKRKLLILTLNGILVDVLQFNPYNREPDMKFTNNFVFKRPFYGEFLHFCFQNFDLAIWSSRIHKNTDRLLDFLFGRSKHQLVFSWDQSQCTETGICTPGQLNRNKPLFLKELRKVWEKENPNLSFQSGYYNKTNTVLLDDSPFKALRNPPHTSFFPNPYKYDDENDNALGDGGSIRTYLEGLASADDAREYIKQNPFGQAAVTESNPYWNSHVQPIMAKWVPKSET